VHGYLKIKLKKAKGCLKLEILKLKHIFKIYGEKVQFRALKDINLSIEKGEFVGIMGPSGSGKTTLLNVIPTIAPLHPERY